MKHFALAFAAAAALTGGAHAADPAKAAESLAKSSGCLACHTVDKKLIGPSYREIAAKYRDDKAAEDKLFAKVKSGGKGVWGEIAMPPNAHVRESDIRSIVRWILSLR